MANNSKTPSAEEILDKYNLHNTYHPYGHPKEVRWHDNENCAFCDHESEVIDAMVEFAKIHVKAALESAAKNAYAQESTTGHVWEVNNDSIINAYTDENIEY